MSEPEMKHVGKIAGWLALPGLGLIISLMLSISEAWPLVTSAVRSPSLVATFTAIIIVFWVAIVVVVSALFFTKHQWAPYSYIAYLVVMVLLAWPVVAPSPTSVETANVEIAPSDLVRSVVQAVVWIPYFYSSKRVKLTFVKTWRSPKVLV
jgi:hypothetical protein